MLATTQRKAVVLLGCLIASSSAAADQSAPLSIGSRRELFVDHFLIDRMDNVRLTLNRPRDEGVVLKFDQPWEGAFCGYCTILHAGNKFQVYYRGLPEAGQDGSANEVYCYAESQDGMHFTKPELGLFEVHGTTRNNVILANAAPTTHNFSPLIDRRSGVDERQRYKALGGTMESGLIAYTSPDGIHWGRLQETPVLTKEMVPFPYMFDSQNLAFWSEAEGKYLCYFRVFQDGIRRICRTTSDDFLHWDQSVLMQYRHHGGDAPVEHLYTNQTHPYVRAPHIYVAIAARFMPGRQVLTDDEARTINVNPAYFRDTSDAIFMTSRGGEIYDRDLLSGFIRPGIGPHNWVSRTNYPALNVVQTSDTEMSVYVNQDYAQPTAHLRRYSLRLDGFASVRAEYEGGEFVTKPIVFDGRQLAINFATSAAGSMRVEIMDEQGQPMPGYSLGECREQIGNELERIVSWQSGADVKPLAGRHVRLRFVMCDADLYALRFVPDQQGR